MQLYLFKFLVGIPINLRFPLLLGGGHTHIPSIYTWNPNDPCFDWKRPCFGGGWSSKIKVIWVPSIYVYATMMISAMVMAVIESAWLVLYNKYTSGQME